MVAPETLGSEATMVARSASGSPVGGGWFSSTGGAGAWSAGLGGSQVEQNMLRERTSCASFDGGGLAASCLTGLAWCAGRAVLLLSLPRRYLASTTWFTPSAARIAQTMIMKTGSVQKKRLR